jgi:magnesium chelatase family protein
VLATTRTFSLLGVSAREVIVEVDVRPRGLPNFAIVGLPDRAVRESRERVRAAIENSGFDFPLQRITVNLAPASLRKVGPSFDLAIAAGILLASGQLPPVALDGCALAGELALDGGIRPVPGTLPMVECAHRSGLEKIVVPATVAAEATTAIRLGLESPVVVPLDGLAELEQIGTETEPDCDPREEPAGSAVESNGARPADEPDLADLRGQAYLRRALEISAAGGHGLLMVGPPGAGKSMAARRIPSILPPLTPPESLEVLRIASACGGGMDGIPRRPFRAPHHTISPPGLVGGGSPARAGEITLAHRGVLFLDELGEFDRSALEALRQPLEEGQVSIVRARSRLDLPCRFVLVAAANPCPCGRGERDGECSCTPSAIARYEAKLSGALADRIDIVLGVEQPTAEAMAARPGEASESVRKRVASARQRQAVRLGGRANAEMSAAETRAHCRLTEPAASLLAAGYTRHRLSGRGHDRVARVARTIADLDGAELIEERHVGEALSLRRRAEQR